VKLSIDQTLVRAKRLARKGRFEQAATLYRDVIDAYPKNQRALQGLAALKASGSGAPTPLDAGPVARINDLAKMYHQGRLKELIEQASPLVEQVPRSVPLWMLLGASHIGLGRPDRAVACFESILRIDPGHAEAHNNLGTAFQAGGDLTSAQKSFARAVHFKPNHAEAHFNLGNILGRKREFEAAIESYNRSLEFKPDYAEAHNNLGSVLKEAGELDRATESYARALKFKPDYADAHNNFGNALKARGELTRAIAHYRRALDGGQNLAAIYSNLGSALREAGELLASIDSYGRALRHKPDHGTAHGNLGNALQEKGDLAAAIRCYRRGLTIIPSQTEWYVSIANSEKERGHTDEARLNYQRAIILSPTDLKHRYLAALLLTKIAHSVDQIRAAREHFGAGISDLGRLAHTLEEPEARIPAAAFDLAYHDQGDRDLMVALSQLFRAKAPSLNYTAPRVSSWAGQGSRRIKVGICSQYLANHTIGKLYKGLIEKIDRSRFDLTLLHASRSRHDAFSANLDHQADKSIILPANLSDQQGVIAGEAFDVLFYPDIGMAPATYFLAHARLAPVQVVGWGHPDTTGIDTVDYFLSAASIEPEDADHHYSERLIRFSRLPTCYEPLLIPDAIPTRAELGLAETGTLYGCPQSLFKFHPDFDAVLAAIAEGDPSGHIVVIEGKQPSWTELLRQRWAGSFPILNQRVLFVPRQSLDGFMKLMAHFDVLLDPIHFGSGNTMYESQVFGTPTVTWPGRFMRGRIVAGAYRQMGIKDPPVANSIEDYASVALKYGKDPVLREAARREFLEASGSRLFADKGVIREYEEFFTAAVLAAGAGERLPKGWMPGL
jgi:protein O-GlcNAc transferase